MCTSNNHIKIKKNFFINAIKKFFFINAIKKFFFSKMEEYGITLLLVVIAANLSSVTGQCCSLTIGQSAHFTLP